MNPLLIGRNINSWNKMQHIHCNNNDHPPKKCVEFDLEFDYITLSSISSLNNLQNSKMKFCENIKLIYVENHNNHHSHHNHHRLHSE
jgi:hypothetical protein